MQNQHSAMYREEEREMMPMLQHFGVGVIPWGPVAAGRELYSRPFWSQVDANLVLCRPYKDLEGTARGKSEIAIKDGKGYFVSPIS